MGRHSSLELCPTQNWTAELCPGEGTWLSLLSLLQENEVTKLYMELVAENKQQLSRLEFAKKIVEKVPAYSSLQDWGAPDWGSNLLSLGIPHPSLSLHIQVWGRAGMETPLRKRPQETTVSLTLILGCDSQHLWGPSAPH